MCGIAGIFNRTGAPADPATLIRMTRTLTHRGPDEEGYFWNGGAVRDWPLAIGTGQGQNNQPPTANCQQPPLHGSIPGARDMCGLGHRRLSIIDLSSGQQPLSNEDGTVWVAFNGEIYNFQELHAELEGNGHIFRTHSDTEMIVQGGLGGRCSDTAEDSGVEAGEGQRRPFRCDTRSRGQGEATTHEARGLLGRPHLGILESSLRGLFV